MLAASRLVLVPNVGALTLRRHSHALITGSGFNRVRAVPPQPGLGTGCALRKDIPCPRFLGPGPAPVRRTPS
jgi:hypothetical protein